MIASNRHILFPQGDVCTSREHGALSTGIIDPNQMCGVAAVGSDCTIREVRTQSLLLPKLTLGGLA
jgi:hypothetical protein